jgi:hypothetical protein
MLALAALPPIAVTLALGLLGTAELAGARPLARPAARGLPETIVLGDSGGAVRLLEQGARPDRVGLIRRGVLWAQPVLATPFEAAVLVRDVRMLDLLESYGEIGTARAFLACLARDIDAPGVATHLVPGGTSGCETGRAFANLVARPGS